MSAPCCAKCSNTHFLRRPYHGLNAYLIYCSKCGTVVGALPLSLKTIGKSNMSTGSSGGKTASDSWTMTG
jgi:hypothetical protein